MCQLIHKYRAIFTALVVFIALSASGTESRAQVTFLTDRDEYIANHPDQLVQTFEDGNVAPGGETFCDTVLINSSSDDPCFDPGDILPGLEFFSNPTFGSFYLVGAHDNGHPNPRNGLGRQTDGKNEFIEITLPPPGVLSAGVTTGCFDGEPPCNGVSLFQVYGAGGVLLDEITIPVTDELETFIGFDSTTPVERVTVSDFQGNATVEAVTEVRFDQPVNPIPALSEWAMIAAAAGLGLVGVWFTVRRRRASSAA
ncbi:MAG: IPTL-CTERM sorting domain-containing protein [Thermodesulfobacteriota bacterium]